jgi:hypothetical protein
MLFLLRTKRNRLAAAELTKKTDKVTGKRMSICARNINKSFNRPPEFYEINQFSSSTYLSQLIIHSIFACRGEQDSVLSHAAKLPVKSSSGVYVR